MIYTSYNKKSSFSQGLCSITEKYEVESNKLKEKLGSSEAQSVRELIAEFHFQVIKYWRCNMRMLLICLISVL